jgi:hypothetical protein
MHARTLVLSLVLSAVAAASATAQTASSTARRTWANPVDIDYRYNFEQTHQGVSYRTGADPVVVLHRDRYYLFATLADGYWTSRDLTNWSFVKPDVWPMDGNVAPAVVSDGEKLYVLPSSFEPRPLMASANPETGQWSLHTRIMPPVPGAVGLRDERNVPEGRLPPGPWDPDLFIDDDGKWYLYWGSSNVYPLYGAALNPEPPVRFEGAVRPMLSLDPERHGWERFGQDHTGALPDGTAVKPFLEGAWMTRRGGRYYLQYGAPGTEYNAYATGTYVGSSPLGPFEYAPYNPVAYKPGGFVHGAGHGSTFQDRFGNWWNTGTAWVGVNWTFERRVAMFPAGFHNDGQMWVSSRFGDFPQRMPDGPVTDPDSLFTGWMPLSYRATASASSTLGEFSAERATDEDPRTFWVAAGKEAGQTLTVDLGTAKTVNAVQVNYADYQAGVYGDAPGRRTRFRIMWSLDGETWTQFASRMNSDRDSPNAYVEGDRAVKARYVRYVHGEAPGAHLAISDFRVFGTAEGPAPAAPQTLIVTRGQDQRNAMVRFDAVPDPEGSRVLGYNIRWGVAADRLNLTYQVWADELKARGGQVEIRALNLGVGYHFAVEAFGESGVSPLSPVVAAPAGVTDPSQGGEPGLPQPSSPGTPPPSGVRITTIPPVYISGAPPVTGRKLPATGTPGADGLTTPPAAPAPTTPPAPATTEPDASSQADRGD